MVGGNPRAQRAIDDVLELAQSTDNTHTESQHNTTQRNHNHSYSRSYRDSNSYAATARSDSATEQETRAGAQPAAQRKMASKAQQMGEARDRDAMGVLMRAVQAGQHSTSDSEAIKNFCYNETIKASTKQARISMYNEAMRRSLFIEGLPVGTSNEQVKRLMQSKLYASPAASQAPDHANGLCSVFVNQPPEYAEFMYAIVTLNDAKHAQGILGVMDNELVTGTKTKLMVEGVGVLVQLKARAGEAPTSQALARAYGLFIERYKADLRRGVAPKLPKPAARSMAVKTASPAKPASDTAAPLAAAVAPTPAHAPSLPPTTPPPLAKAFSKTRPKQMAVFHDAENCYLGKAGPGVSDGDLAYNYYSAVRALVAAEGGDGSGTWQLFLHHQEHLHSHPSKLTMQELSSLGIDNIDPGPKSGAVDIKMKDNISAFCEANRSMADNFIVVILSGDKDFSADLRNLQRAGYSTVVAHPPDVAKAFISLAKESGPVVEWQPIRQSAGGLEYDDVANSSKKYRPPNNSRLTGYCATPSAVTDKGWVKSWVETGDKTTPGTARDWDELAAMRKGTGSVCSDDGSRHHGHVERSNDDDCGSVAGSECSLSSVSQISSVTSPSASSPTVSQWLKAKKLTFATQALQDFGYRDDDFTLMDFAADVNDHDTLADILKVVDAIPGASKPHVNKMRRELKKLATSGVSELPGEVNLAAASG